MPCGLCWSSGASNNQIAGDSTGCLRVTGTTFDAPGEYLLHIIVDANVQTIFGAITVGNQNLSTQGLHFYLRVRVPLDTCHALDTLVTGLKAGNHPAVTTLGISGNTTICPGTSTTLTATGNNYYAYQWSNGTLTASTQVSAAGTYRVTAYGACNEDTAVKTITVIHLTTRLLFSLREQFKGELIRIFHIISMTFH